MPGHKIKYTESSSEGLLTPGASCCDDGTKRGTRSYLSTVCMLDLHLCLFTCQLQAGEKRTCLASLAQVQKSHMDCVNKVSVVFELTSLVSTDALGGP